MKGSVVTVVLFQVIVLSFCSTDERSCELKVENKFYGKDYSNTRNVSVQIGRCVQTEARQDNNTHSVKPRNATECLPQCVATSWSHTDLLLLKQMETASSATKCHFTQDHCSSCQLVSSTHTYFPDQPSFTKTVDLGMCKGTCSSESNSCLPLRTIDIPIQGPNGYTTATKIKSCGCVFPKCYRQNYLVEVANPATNSTKFLDVGKCTGKCIGEIVFECFPSDDDCLIEIPMMSDLCVPTSTTQKLGTAVITSCGCGTRF